MINIKDNKLLVVSISFIVLGVSLIGGSAIIDMYNKSKVNSYYDMNFTKPNKSNKDGTIDFSDVDLTSNMVVEKVNDYKSVIEIPSLSIVSPITEGVGSNMDYSVGHFPATPKLNEEGNICLAGHSSEIYDCVFNDLHKVDVGDTINIYDESGKKYEYTVVKSRTISPDSLGVLNDYGDNRLTIVTCTDKGTRRLLITAKILSEDEKVQLMSKFFNSAISDVNNTVKEFKTSMQEVVNLTDFLDESRPYTHNQLTVSEGSITNYQDNIFRKLR